MSTSPAPRIPAARAVAPVQPSRSRATQAPRGVSSSDVVLQDLAVRSPERTALSALDIARGPSLAPPAGVILAARNAAAIAVRKPDSLVVDFEHQRVFRGADRVEFACSSVRTQLFTVCSMACVALGGRLNRYDLADALWGTDPDGGPLWSDSVIYVRLCRARPFFSWAGLSHRAWRRADLIEVRPTAPCRDGVLSSFRIGNHGIYPLGARA